MILNDRMLGIAALLLSAFMTWFGHDLQAPFAYEPVGPRAFPLLLAGVIGLCGLRLVLRGGAAAAPNPPGANSRIMLMIALVAVYAWLFQWLGFVISTALMAIFVGRLFGGSWAKCALGGVLMGVFFFYLFDRVLDVVLPLGLLEGAMSGMLDHLSLGFGVAFSATNLLVALIGSFFGTIVGVLPGLGPINGVAMLVPIAFAMGLPPDTALILLAAVYVGAEYGGRITSILINVPGEAAAVMTTLDGYPLARQGLASVALSLSAWSSFIGSLVAIIGITAFAPFLARWALAFGPAEYFVLMVFAFCALTSLLGEQPVKGVLAAAIGLSIATIGVDSNSGVYRYTFDLPHLADGLDFVVVVIGLFAVAEMLQMLENKLSGLSVEVPPSQRKLFNLKELAFTWWSTVRGSLLGFVIGVLPGAGASVASAVAYANEKRYVEGKKDGSARFGRGDMRGLAAPEAANNSAATGSFIPMLTLGVPGSGTTAVMMGALTLYNITPGPVLFEQQPALVWGLIASMFIANVMLFIMNVPMVRVFAAMLSIPGWLLVPGILAVSFIGVYAISATTFDLLAVVIIGVIGYLLRKLQMPMAPMVLGVVLGDMMEQNLRRALSITDGEPSILWGSPVCIALWVLAVVVVLGPMLYRKITHRKLVEVPQA